MEDGVYVPPDLSPEERRELESIRRRKQELLGEIQRLRDELSEAIRVEGLEANEGSKTLQRNRKMGMGRKKFNMDPKKGIQFLVEQELLRHTAEDIARFLYKGEGLNKTAIGDYLGEREEFNLGVLHVDLALRWMPGGWGPWDTPGTHLGHTWGCGHLGTPGDDGHTPGHTWTHLGTPETHLGTPGSHLDTPGDT
uniref:Uncharacterized protein n=1 Tax=Geospiza parvula TaxID=87175 RepID=A0A8U8BL87_GEOPR